MQLILKMENSEILLHKVCNTSTYKTHHVYKSPILKIWIFLVISYSYTCDVHYDISCAPSRPLSEDCQTDETKLQFTSDIHFETVQGIDLNSVKSTIKSKSISPNINAKYSYDQSKKTQSSHVLSSFITNSTDEEQQTSLKQNNIFKKDDTDKNNYLDKINTVMKLNSNGQKNIIEEKRKTIWLAYTKELCLIKKLVNDLIEEQQKTISLRGAEVKLSRNIRLFFKGINNGKLVGTTGNYSVQYFDKHIFSSIRYELTDLINRQCLYNNSWVSNIRREYSIRRCQCSQCQSINKMLGSNLGINKNTRKRIGPEEIKE